MMTVFNCFPFFVNKGMYKCTDCIGACIAWGFAGVDLGFDFHKECCLCSFCLDYYYIGLMMWVCAKQVNMMLLCVLSNEIPLSLKTPHPALNQKSYRFLSKQLCYPSANKTFWNICTQACFLVCSSIVRAFCSVWYLNRSWKTKY